MQNEGTYLPPPNSDPWVLVALLAIGLVAVLLRWGTLGAYTFAAAWHELKKRLNPARLLRMLPKRPNALAAGAVVLVAYLLMSWLWLVNTRIREMLPVWFWEGW